MTGPGLSLIVYSLLGDEEEARQFATAELERIAGEMDKEDGNSSQQPKFSKVYTAYLPPVDPPLFIRPSDYIPIHFPWDDEKGLAAAATREVADLYVAGGEERLQQFLAVIPVTTERYLMTLGADPGWPNAIAFTDAAEAQKAGEAVAHACGAAVRDLLTRAEAVVRDVGKQAVTIAGARLKAAREEIVGEARRYLDLAGSHRADGEEIVTGQRTRVVVRGDGLVGLTAALRDLQGRRRALDAAAADYGQKEKEVRQQRQDEMAQFGGPRFAPGVFADVSPEEMARSFPDAAADLESAAADLAFALSVYCESFPILARAWTRLELPDTVRIAQSGTGEATLAGSTRAAGAAVARFGQTIWSTLQASWEANLAMDARLAPDFVWRYPPVISAAVDALGYSSPSVEARVVQARLEQETGMSLPAKLSLCVGGLALGTELLLGAGVLGVVLAVAGLALDLLTSVSDYQAWLLQDDAFNAALDPSKALASEPGYEGLVVSLAVTLFGLKGVRDSLKAARVARTAAATAQALDSAMVHQ
jgi:hypothetical protein